MSKKKPTNFGRFYALMKQRPEVDKDSIVSQFTDGRSTHLRDMSLEEYLDMCDFIEYGTPRRSDYEQRRRMLQSSVLLRIGRLGINTVDNWDGINAFCLSPKIAGKELAKLNVGELEHLVKKLESIISKGGLKTTPGSSEAEGCTVNVPRLYFNVAKQRYHS